MPGTYYISIFQPEPLSRGEVESVAFHETYPGRRPIACASSVP